MKAKRNLGYLTLLAVMLTISAVFVLPGALAIEHSFIPIEFPGASWTEAYGINDLGHIVGWDQDTTVHHSFLYEEGSFTSIDIDIPGTHYEHAHRTNNSDAIVVYYADAD